MKVLGCPWCDAMPEIIVDEKYVSIYCVNPDCRVQPTADRSYSSEQDAVDAWNDRLKGETRRS